MCVENGSMSMHSHAGAWEREILDIALICVEDEIMLEMKTVEENEIPYR